MKGRIPSDVVEEVRRRTDIVALISSHVGLRKAGRNYIGLCPFHGEKTPSFNVSPDKQMYYCFGCGEGGNALTFVMKANGMTFVEAVRHLADRAGVTLPERVLGAERERPGKREKLLHVNALAEACFSRWLFSPSGEKARCYLQNRGIGEEAARRFSLGFGRDGWHHLRDFFQGQKVPLELGEEAGLLIKGEAGGYYDRFRGRLIFPIHDGYDRVVAFGGRVIDRGEPKYVNSPETPVYTKGKILYGLAVTREAIREAGFVIVVEGYFDLLSLWSAGIRNVVATLGTALTRDHAEIIRRYTDQVTVVFDADAAGQKAMMRSIGIFLSVDLLCRALVLPEGYDPDGYIRTFGAERFAAAVAEAKPAVEYYIDTTMGQRGSLDADRRRLREALSFVADIKSEAERDLFVRRIAERLGMDQNALKTELFSLNPPDVPVTVSGAMRRQAPQADPVELKLIHVLLEHPERVEQVWRSGALDFFSSPELKALGTEMRRQMAENGALDVSAALETITDEGMKGMLTAYLFEGGSWDGAGVEKYIDDAVRRVKTKWFRRKHQELKAELLKAQGRGDVETCRRLLEEKARLLKEETLKT